MTDFHGAVDVNAFTNALASAIRTVSSSQQVNAGQNVAASNIAVLRISEAPGGRSVVGWDFVGLSLAQADALNQLLQTSGAAVASNVNQQLQQTSSAGTTTGTISIYRGTDKYFHINAGGMVSVHIFYLFLSALCCFVLTSVSAFFVSLFLVCFCSLLCTFFQWSVRFCIFALRLHLLGRIQSGFAIARKNAEHAFPAGGFFFLSAAPSGGGESLEELFH